MALPGITEVRAEWRRAQADESSADYDLLLTVQKIAVGHLPGTRSGYLSMEEQDTLQTALSAVADAHAHTRNLAAKVAFMEET